MICDRYKMESGILEERLVLISPEALLWLLPLEGLPEETPRADTKAPERQPKSGEAAEVERRVRQDLLRDFISFGHSVALQSLFLRVESIEVRRGRGSAGEYKAHV
jgi:hypothetical protein